MLYDDSEQLEVRHVISLAHHEVSIFAGGESIPEGELWIRRNAIRLSRKDDAGTLTTDTFTSKPFFLFSENCSDKEDFYHVLLQNQEKHGNAPERAPTPLQYDVHNIVTLVQRLHSSEEQLQTRWINGLIGRLFLALYKTPEMEHLIRTKMAKKIARVKTPAFLTNIILRNIDMGEGAPYITNPRLKDLTVDGACAAEADIKYSGNFRIEVAATAKFDLGTRFKTREVNLVLAVVLKKLEGHAIIRFKPPPSNRVWVSFETMPKVEMSIEPIVSSRQITYNIILRAIESRIREVIAETLVMPHWDDIPFLNTAGQRYRGGIWREEGGHPRQEASEPSVCQNLKGSEDSILGLEKENPSTQFVHHQRKTMSTPVLSTLPSPSDKGLSQSENPDNGTDPTTEVSSHAEPQSYSNKPKALRSSSFVSSASPVVSMDTTPVDALKQLRQSEQQGAASAMIAISNRSQPSSPADSPIGSPSKPSIFTHHRESHSSVSSRETVEHSFDEELEPHSNSRSGTLSSYSSGSATAIGRSLRSAPDTDQTQRHASSIYAASPGSEKRHSLAALGVATTVARKWGLGVLGRNNDVRSGTDNTIDGERMGTPTHPMGRGRPLPPPGTPLPRPERKGTRSKPNLGKVRARKPVPTSTSAIKQDGSSPLSLNLPRTSSQRAQGSIIDDGDQNGLLIVAAPSTDSEPSTPSEETRNEILDTMEVDEIPNLEDTGVSIGVDGDALDHGLQSHDRILVASNGEDSDSGPSSWDVTREEDIRGRRHWVEADPEQI